MVNESMKVSQKGINLIKQYEGLKLEAYKDQVGVWTIGYGHTQGVHSGMVITKEQALTYLEEDINSHVSGIYNYITVSLNQNQFDALASFHFNLGEYILKDTSLLQAINAEMWEVAAEKIKEYNKAGGEVLPGLVNRRQKEANLFLADTEDSSNTSNIRLKEQLAPVIPDYNCFGIGNQKIGITVHQTGNPSYGADAQMHANLQENKYSESWHWQVDDKEAIQSFKHEVSCYHASDGSGDGNMNTIAIEGCINSNGNYTKAIENMAKLIAVIMKQENLTINDVYQHNHWARDNKNCPAQIRAGKNGVNWVKLLDMVKQFDGSEGEAPEGGNENSNPSNQTGILNKYPESGIFFPNTTIKVRDTPSIRGNHVATYYSGESVTYHTVHIGNGYVWLEYTSYDGKQRYIPCREYSNGVSGQLWGTIGSTPSGGSSAETGIIDKYPESGIFSPNDTIKVRDTPSTGGNHVVTYYSGESVTYHTVHVGNGYIWLQYLSSTGKQRYIPCRKYIKGISGNLWGTIRDIPSEGGSQTQEGVIKRYLESGTFTSNSTIKVRNIPNVEGNHVATYYSGESIAYHTVHIGNGYVWLQYTSFNGQHRFIPCREYSNGVSGKMWGTIN